MTNEEKYKTTEEREKAYKDFCHSHECTHGCPLADCDDCHFPWLALEAEEEKPEPYPFCGSVCHVESTVGLANVTCDDDSCCYKSREFSTREEAIAAHNRVCRAVKAAQDNNN